MTQTCTICTHAQEHGWWGDIAPARTHCRNCHRSWASLREAHCVSCCEHFASNAAADWHRVGDDPCQAPGKVVRRDGKARYREQKGRFGVTWYVINHRKQTRPWK